MAGDYSIGERWVHGKASEEHVAVTFRYPGQSPWSLSVPIKCRRAGLDLETEEEIAAHVEATYAELAPERRPQWLRDQQAFWAGSRSDVTKPFFERMAGDFGWYSYDELPSTSNPARRVQDLKDLGYSVATRKRGNRALEYMLLPKPRGPQSGYEYWSGPLRARILRLLKNHDAFEGRTGNPQHLLPDHKFPEARWNRDTRRDTLEGLSDADIRRDFQLLSNQRNLQKREVCRGCRETGRRGHPFGMPFWWQGDERWPLDVPRSGKEAERGCIGCGWHDLARWREAVLRKLIDEG